MRKSTTAIFCAAVSAMACFWSASPVFAAWLQTEGGWRYETDGRFVTGWVTDNQDLYYIGDDGYLKSGWMFLSDAWYFLNPIHDGTFGKLRTGWQWIDGYCYYFQDDGKMLADRKTPDGYQVNESGRWCENGLEQYKAVSEGKTYDSGSSSGRRSRHGSDDSTAEKDLEVSYTVCYRDIESGTAVQVLTGMGNMNEVITMQHPDIAGYLICEGQRTQFILSQENLTINIYYEKQAEASPSDARKVSWKVYFVEKGNPAQEIFVSQKGESEEGTEIIIDFPEEFIKSGMSYHSLVSSPYRISLYGTGVQKYYIEFEKTEIEKEPDPDIQGKRKLEYWLEVSRRADSELTGMQAIDGQLVTNTGEESRQRLRTLVSMVNDTQRKEVYIIARNHIADTFSLGQMPGVRSVSEAVMDNFQIGNDSYIVLKAGFECSFEEAGCSHSFSTVNYVKTGCLLNGSQTVLCSKCGYGVTIMLPALGHREEDGDGLCDVCAMKIDENEMTQAAHYEVGDVMVREIGDKMYLFRCIDEDYEDSLENSRKAALFLCDEVIPSDVESTMENHKILTFGNDNNYKTSSVRKWMKENFEGSITGMHEGYIGIPLAYSGMTEKESYEQFDESELTAWDKPFQLLEDYIFLPSVEEGVKYSEYLWKFNGSDKNNPQSQYSAYSKGYWLRTPQYKENRGEFAYSDSVYMVDLVNGNIHTADVGNTSIGIRPLITVPQS